MATDTVEAVLGELMLTKMASETAAKVGRLCIRLQSAHDAELGALRREVSDSRVNLPALAEKAERCERGMNDAFLRLAEMRQRAESAESRLREAHGLLREADRFLGFDGAEGELSDRIDRAMEGEDGNGPT